MPTTTNTAHDVVVDLEHEGPGSGRPAMFAALRLAWYGAALIGCALIIVTRGPELTHAASAGSRLRLGPLMAGVLMSTLAILNRAGKSRASHRAVGMDVDAWSMLPPTMIGFTADKILRFGGLSGLAVMAKHGDRMGYPRGAVLASTVVAKLSNLVSLGLFLVLAVGALWLDGELTGWWLAAGTGLTIYMAASVVGLLAAAKNRSRAERWWSWVERRAPVASRLIGGRHPIAAIARGVSSARAHPARSLQVAAHATLAKTLGVGLLLAASHAASIPLRPHAALVIYATVLLASVASITPGGLGAVEASAVAVLVRDGVGLGDAVVVVALFRALDLWFPLIVGAIAAGVVRRRHRGNVAPVDASHCSARRASATNRRPSIGASS